MVGVPDFFKWLWGPSLRTTCPIWNFFSPLMKRGPSTRDMSSAVSAAPKLRKVR